MYICKFKNNPIYTPDDRWDDMVFDHEISSSDFSSGDSDNSPVRSIRSLNDNPRLLLDDLVDARELSMQPSSRVTFHIPPQQPEQPIYYPPPTRLEES